MAALVIEDITHLCFNVNMKIRCDVSDALDSLFSLYIVCFIKRRIRERDINISYKRYYLTFLFYEQRIF